jgi:succinyl-CoA synthetase beta subunit
MNLREYQAKKIFSTYGIPVPRGEVVSTPNAAVEVAGRLGGPVVLKPQLGVKGRGKVGGIGFADDPAMAGEEAKRLFDLTIRGEAVKTLLVEEKMPIADEIYLAVTVDYAARRPLIMASSGGGVDIETVAESDPKRLIRIPVNILVGPTPADFVPVEERLGGDVARYLEILYRAFRDCDAEIVEINPLARTEDGHLCAVDAVLNVNPDSVFRHDDLLTLKSQIPADDPIAEEAARSKWTYIDLSGDIGILSSGAGLTMTILDLIHNAGGKPANFLDTAQIDDEGIYQAFDLLSRARKTRVLLVNIFAGLNRCDRLAEGILRYLEDHPLETPLVVRMVGNREEEGLRLLEENGITPFSRLEDAVDAAVHLAGEDK